MQRLILGACLLPYTLAVDFDVEHFGASARAPVADAGANTAAFRAAIQAVSQAGGGTVYARAPGTYVTGRIEMLSDVTLFIGAKTIIMASPNISDWTTRKFDWPADECSYCLSEGQACSSSNVELGVLGGLFYALSASNFTITGGGTVNGAAKTWNISPKKGPNNPLGLVRTQMFVFIMCSDVVVEKLQIQDSPMWTLNPRYSKRLRFRELTITAPALGSRGHNTDGFDPWACDDVEFTDSYYSGGDDCVAIKSGVDLTPTKPWTCKIPSSNILVRNVTCDGSHGLTIGSEVSGGIVNVTLDNVRITNSGPSVRIKSNCGRSGYLHNVTYNNIQAGTVDTAVWIDQQYGSGATACTASNVTRFSDITVSNLVAEKVGTAYTIIGLNVVDDPKNSISIVGVKLENITVKSYGSLGTCHYSEVDTAGTLSPPLHRGVGCVHKEGDTQEEMLV